MSYTVKTKTASFLYQLMRDHVPVGVVQKVLNDSQDSVVTCTNEWLARYAEVVADSLLQDKEP
jgi:hypothetical protein